MIYHFPGMSISEICAVIPAYNHKGHAGLWQADYTCSPKEGETHLTRLANPFWLGRRADARVFENVAGKYELARVNF